MISSGFSMLHPVLNVFLYRYQMLKFLLQAENKNFHYNRAPYEEKL